MNSDNAHRGSLSLWQGKGGVGDRQKRVISVGQDSLQKSPTFIASHVQSQTTYMNIEIRKDRCQHKQLARYY